MAKKATGPNANVIAALKAIEATGRATKDVGEPLLKQGLIEVNTGDVVDGLAAARLTETGKAAIMNAITNTATVAPTPDLATSFAIISNATLPASKRGNRLGSGAPAKYPFASLEVGQMFFVGATEKMPNPLKTLGSTVAVQNHKYSEPTGEVKKVERTKRGKGNHAEVDANGQKVRMVVDVNVRKPVRKFSIRAVVSGVAYGEWIAPADGAIIARTL